MAKRPDDSTLSRFSRVMRERGRPHRVIDMPGCPGERVAIWCPTDTEESEADAAARTHLTGALKLNALQLSLAMETKLHERERQLELLALVLRDPDDPTAPYAESVDDLRDADHGLEPDQREQLMAAIADFRRERYEAHVPEEDEKIVEAVRALGEAGALSQYVTSCDIDSLRSIVLALAKASRTQTAQNSSGT